MRGIMTIDIDPPIGHLKNGMHLEMYSTATARANIILEMTSFEICFCVLILLLPFVSTFASFIICLSGYKNSLNPLG